MVDAEHALPALLSAATADFGRAGIADPRREAIRLWSDIRSLAPAQAIMAGDVAVTTEEAERFVNAAQRRAAGEPLAYVSGWTGFRRLTLHCDRRALIPRPETEGLVELALARVRHGVAADIGTGTGAIALALRDEGEFDEVIGVDLSADALALASANGQATGRHVTWMLGDLVAPLRGDSLDLLVSNPPYLTRGEHDTLDHSVRDYEPAMALVGGDDGQAIVNRLIHDARRVVRRDGWMLLEADCRRVAENARVAAAEGWQDVSVQEDLFGRARYLLARRGSES